jgi:hypothetical protein
MAACTANPGMPRSKTLQLPVSTVAGPVAIPEFPHAISDCDRLVPLGARGFARGYSIGLTLASMKAISSGSRPYLAYNC